MYFTKHSPRFSLALAANNLFRSKDDALEWPFFLGGGGGGPFFPSALPLPLLLTGAATILFTSPVERGRSPLLLLARRWTFAASSSSLFWSTSSDPDGSGESGGGGVWAGCRGEVGGVLIGDDGGDIWWGTNGDAVALTTNWPGLTGVQPSRACLPEGGGSSWPGAASSRLGLATARGLAISDVPVWPGLRGPAGIWDESTEFVPYAIIFPVYTFFCAYACSISTPNFAFLWHRFDFCFLQIFHLPNTHVDVDNGGDDGNSDDGADDDDGDDDDGGGGGADDEGDDDDDDGGDGDDVGDVVMMVVVLLLLMMVVVVVMVMMMMLMIMVVVVMMVMMMTMVVMVMVMMVMMMTMVVVVVVMMVMMMMLMMMVVVVMMVMMMTMVVMVMMVMMMTMVVVVVVVMIMMVMMLIDESIFSPHIIKVFQEDSHMEAEAE